VAEAIDGECGVAAGVGGEVPVGGGAGVEAGPVVFAVGDAVDEDL
jgi:hypothetical protein